MRPSIEGKILLVDDERDLIELYPHELRRQGGLDVHGFTDPILALQEFKLASSAYVMVISDIRMPKMNGFDFIRHIKKIKPEVKVLFITAFEINSTEFSTVLPSIKVDGFIKKPFTPGKLIDAIEAIVVEISNQ